MKAYSINPQEKKVQELDIKMQANTVYTFFSSILIDELTSLKGHIIYTDANAPTEEKTPFFIGEQLIVGDALIIGKNGMQEVDAFISKDELKSLINYDVAPFYTDAFKLLKGSDINLYRLFQIENDEKIELNIEWVLYAFSIADEATQNYFLTELKSCLDEKKDLQKVLENFAKLAYNASK